MICAFGAPPACDQSNCSSVLMPGQSQQHHALALVTRHVLAGEHLLQEVGEAGAIARSILRKGRPVVAKPGELELLAQLDDAIVLQAHQATSSSASYTANGCCRLSIGSATR
jgi:hypothetical protein